MAENCSIVLDTSLLALVIADIQIFIFRWLEFANVSKYSEDKLFNAYYTTKIEKSKRFSFEVEDFKSSIMTI